MCHFRMDPYHRLPGKSHGREERVRCVGAMVRIWNVPPKATCAATEGWGLMEVKSLKASP